MNTAEKIPPAYSVIIPAWNEARYLPATLERLRTAMAAVSLAGEVIVVDNNSTDATGEIARAAGAKVVDEPYNRISRARNTGGRAAAGKFLVFLDADTAVTPAILQTALDRLNTGEYYGGGIAVGLDAPVPFPARAFAGFWNFAAERRKWAAGCFIFCLKNAFEAAGGFREDIYAGDEVYFSQALARWGRSRKLKFAFIRTEKIITSSRKLREHSVVKLIVLILLLGIFRPLLRSKRLCSIWYQRG
ncbi:MAG: glycosyltransferase [Victivallaceae bacterium]|nr:glycosyltransferase [Victivallaceae bacterium]